RADSEIELSVNTLISKLQNQSAQNIQNILSKAFGKYVEFRPTKSDFTFEFSKSANPADSHWEILEYLAEHGSLKINGYDYDFWKAMRQTLLKGGEFNICTGNAPAKMILAEISFITGKRFSFTAGDPNTKVSVILKGFSLSDILQNLSNASKTTIVEN
ncbi:MAG TPA: hypothetical protein VNK07_00095, partial [Candidatus Binatia bacterium]|nr:hypothetical protein [Candidatus Binatia bacterium]